MRLSDAAKLTWRSVVAAPLRALLTTLGIAIGVGAVALLTSLGQGLSLYVVEQFTQFGTNLIQIQPGKIQTMGASLGAINTVRPLAIDDRIAIARLPGVVAAVGFAVGNAEVEGNRRQRRTAVYGTDAAFPSAFSYTVSLGEFLPDDDPHAPRALAVLGSKMRDELFGKTNPVGSTVRVGGYRFRVVGVMESKGQVLGFDLDDTIYVPAARAMSLFGLDSLVEINVLYADDVDVDGMIARIERLLRDRHGADDVTVISQQQMLSVMDSILDMLTMAVAGLGGISLLVGAVGILTIMTIAVRERTREVGLLRALGGTRRQILGLFLIEASLLAGIGGLLGLLVGLLGAQLLHWVIPALPVRIPLGYFVLAELSAVTIGVVAGLLPARSAAAMSPIDALRSE